MIRQDTSENQANSIYLAIGSNLGDKKCNIERAKFELTQNNIKIIQVSNYYESLSWPDPKMPTFLNIVLKIKTILKPMDLLKVCKKIEIKLGRKQSRPNAPRECDIDIIDYKYKQSSDKILLPHPRMHNRNFVLFPLFEIDKNWRHPVTKYHIKKLILCLPKMGITSIKQI